MDNLHTYGIHVIGFCGRAGHGKTSAAVALADWIDRTRPDIQYSQLSFATPIRQATMLICPEGKDDPNWRTFAQRIGEIGREIDPNFWIDKLKAEVPMMIEDRECKHHIILIDDVRFDNEAEWIWRMGGKLIRINRPTHPEFLTTKQLEHPSEGGVDEQYVTMTLRNDFASLGDLAHRIRKLSHRLLPEAPRTEQ